MEISNNYTSMQVLSIGNKNNIITSTSNNYQAEMDKLELSSQSISMYETVKTSEYSDEEIAEFLKDKPYTAFIYEYHQKYTPDKGKAYITDLLDIYHNKKPQTPYSWHEKINSEALNKGLDTLEKFKEQLSKEAAAQKAVYIDAALSNLPNVNQYEEDNGISVYHFGGDYNLLHINLKLDTSFMYQDMKVDENGQVMILPKDSGEWVTREEFIEMYPDYELYEPLDLDAHNKIISELNQIEDGITKYAEDFIASLNEEEIQMIKDNDFFSSPALQVTGIKGLEQFTKDIEDIKTAEVRTWSGLNKRREQLIQLAEEQKLKFAQKRAEGVSNYPLYEVIPYTANSERDAKLIAELGLSDYIKIDASKINITNNKINGYSYDKDLFEQYNECYYIPERDNRLYQNIEAISNDEYCALSEIERKQYDKYISQTLQKIDVEYQSMLSMYGSAENIEKAYLYALDNNLSLDILANDYTSAIGVEAGTHRELHSNLNGRDDFLEALFSDQNDDITNKETEITINIELDLKSRYLSSLTKNDNIDTLLDIV